MKRRELIKAIAFVLTAAVIMTVSIIISAANAPRYIYVERESGMFYENDRSVAFHSDVVYVTQTGTRYHLEGCSYLKSSSTELTLSEAEGMGYEPCSKCFQ